MSTAAATHRRAQLAAIVLATAVVGLIALLPVGWRPAAKLVWSYAVYYLGYRILAVQLSCGSLAVSGVPFVLKQI